MSGGSFLKRRKRYILQAVHMKSFEISNITKRLFTLNVLAELPKMSLTSLLIRPHQFRATGGIMKDIVFTCKTRRWCSSGKIRLLHFRFSLTLPYLYMSAITIVINLCFIISTIFCIVLKRVIFCYFNITATYVRQNIISSSLYK